MKLTELKLTEEVGGKNKKLFDANEDDTIEYVKRQLFDARKCETIETVHITMKGQKQEQKHSKLGDMIVRLHDNIEQIDLISNEDFGKRFEQIQAQAEPDAEGFLTYREIGKYEAFKYAGEDAYIFTDWNTKQKITTGDYLVRSADNKNASGFVVSAAEFDKHFEEFK